MSTKAMLAIQFPSPCARAHALPVLQEGDKRSLIETIMANQERHLGCSGCKRQARGRLFGAVQAGRRTWWRFRFRVARSYPLLLKVSLAAKSFSLLPSSWCNVMENGHCASPSDRRAIASLSASDAFMCLLILALKEFAARIPKCNYDLITDHTY
jgi:hypothetical protein